jgi:type I restriction-modification system DNA methylase subunit
MLNGIGNVKSEASMIGEYSKILNEPIFQQEEIKHKNKKEREKSVIAVKERILKNHRLHAVLSMPDELFNPVASVVTAIMVFKANEKNLGRKTWFGYFKDDGFEKRKNRGRIDARNKWKTIKKRWIESYNNLDEIPGLTIKQEVIKKLTSDNSDYTFASQLPTEVRIIANVV